MCIHVCFYYIYRYLFKINNLIRIFALIDFQSIIDQIPHLTPIPDKPKVRNLLVVGYSGSGKSTLSNVLCNTGHYEGKEHPIKKTTNFQKQSFKWNVTEYRVVDIVGFRDIDLTKKEVICEKIAEVIYLLPEGISQVLFVIDGKLSAEEANTYNLLKDFIFNSGIADYITIVRTKFSNFKNNDECKKDKKDLCDENESIAALCKSIVYVDNPPIDIFVHDEDDYETIRINERRRDQSRKILLDHLDNVIREKYYKLKIWDNLHSKTSIKNIAEELERNLKFEIKERERSLTPVPEQLSPHHVGTGWYN
jgi:septin family protein